MYEIKLQNFCFVRALLNIGWPVVPTNSLSAPLDKALSEFLLRDPHLRPSFIWCQNYEKSREKIQFLCSARAFEFRSNWSKMLFVHNMHSVLMSNLFHLNKTSKRIAFESYDANNFLVFQQEASWGGVTKFMVFERLENIGLDLLMVFKLACWIDSQCSRPVHVGVD